MLHETPAEEDIRTAVANGTNITRVSDLPDELQEDMCEFRRSLPFAQIYAIVIRTARKKMRAQHVTLKAF